MADLLAMKRRRQRDGTTPETVRQGKVASKWAQNLVAAIVPRGRRGWRFLFALGILQIGEETAKAPAAAAFRDIAGADAVPLLSAPGRPCGGLRGGLLRPEHNRQVIDALFERGVHLIDERRIGFVEARPAAVNAKRVAQRGGELFRGVGEDSLRPGCRRRGSCRPALGRWRSLLKPPASRQPDRNRAGRTGGDSSRQRLFAAAPVQALRDRLPAADSTAALPLAGQTVVLTGTLAHEPRQAREQLGAGRRLGIERPASWLPAGGRQ